MRVGRNARRLDTVVLMTDRHVSATRGDTTHISCAAWMLPTGASRRIHARLFTDLGSQE